MPRILYVPLVSQQTLDGNEGFREFFDFSTYLRDKGEDIYWYVVLPQWVQDGLRGHDRMQYVYIDNTRDYLVNSIAGFPAYEIAQYFARRGGRFVVDAVLSNCVQYAGYLSCLLNDPVRKSSLPVVIRDHNEDVDFRIVDNVNTWLLLASNYVSCHTALCSETERQVLSTFVSRKTNPSMSKVFRDRSFFWPRAHDLSKVLQVVEEQSEVKKARECPVLLCGGDFNFVANKRFEMKVARKLFVITPIKVLVASWSPRYKVEKVFPQLDRSFIQGINARMGLEVYCRSLASAHLFVSCASEFDLAAHEEEIGRLLYGMVGIFPHEPWVISRLGKDYPFYYNTGNADEATVLAEWIVTNYDEAVEMIFPLILRLRDEQRLSKVSGQVWEEISMLIRNQYRVHLDRSGKDGKLTLFQVVEKVAKGLGNEFHLDVFLDVIEEHLPWLKPWGRKNSLKVLGDVPQSLPTLYDLREILDNLGWVDTCDQANIIVRKE